MWPAGEVGGPCTRAASDVFGEGGTACAAEPAVDGRERIGDGPAEEDGGVRVRGGGGNAGGRRGAGGAQRSSTERAGARGEGRSAPGSLTGEAETGRRRKGWSGATGAGASRSCTEEREVGRAEDEEGGGWASSSVGGGAVGK